MLNIVRIYPILCLPRTFAILLFVTALLGCRGFAQTQFDEAGAEQLVRLINQERAGRGLPPLAVDQGLTEAARKHTQLMVEHKAVSHQFDGEPPMEVRFADENLRSDQQAENIDLSRDVASSHKGLMHSAAHRANILSSNYNAVGVAVLRSGDHVYVTEDFARRLKSYSEPEADAILQRAVENYATSNGMPAPVRKPQSQLRNLACDMARNDSLQSQKVRDLPGVQAVAAWTTAVPGNLSSDAKELLSHPMSSGYSLGACFAPSVSQPGGIYWVVMVVY
jgi:hypothetical protein